MTSFKSRIDSFYAQERRSTLESRFALVWAIVVAVCYLLWNTTPPADRVTRFAIIFAVFGAIVLLVALWAAWRVRGVINRLRSLAPDDRDEVLGQHLTPEAREFYAKRLAAEGSVEFDGLVERFPFSPLDRRETLVLFWAAAAIGAIALAAALGIGGLEQAWREAALAIGMGAVVAMPVLSRRFYRLASVIELTPLAIIEVRADGRRRWLYWTQPLELRNYRWLRRLELAPKGGQGHIPIHYARIGFDRLLAVVLERGGFRKPPHAA